MFPARIAELEKRKMKIRTSRTAAGFGICAGLLLIGFAIITVSQLHADPYHKSFWYRLSWITVNLIGIVALIGGLLHFGSFGIDLVKIIKTKISLKRKEKIRIREKEREIEEEYKRVFYSRPPR